jgi:hypothetical protein
MHVSSDLAMRQMLGGGIVGGKPDACFPLGLKTPSRSLPSLPKVALASLHKRQMSIRLRSSLPKLDRFHHPPTTTVYAADQALKKYA